MVTPDLFTPFQMGAVPLPNRIVMAALTRCRAGAGNVPTSLNALYYSQRASAGLIIAEATQVSPQGVGYPRTPGIYSDAQVAGWQQVTTAVHQAGGRIFLQLWHVGRLSHPLLQEQGQLPVAPSAIAATGHVTLADGSQHPYVTPRPLETEEIAQLILDFRKGAENARRAGFDGIELHAAFGYLFDQFLQDNSNHRTDLYGGSLENRARFLLEVTEAVIGVWGAGRVGIKLSPSNTYHNMADSDPIRTFSYVVEQLNHFPLSHLQIMETGESDLRHGGTLIPTAIFRPLYRGNLMVNGGYDYEKANQVLARQGADLVSFGRLFIANPDLPQRFAQGSQLNPVDRSTYYTEGPKGYIDYPTLNPTKAAAAFGA
ncbi:alkene reductase [Thermostichus vulcanus]|uniref:Alkene reductase n=1 Tax=Thermostichus vulcanus str. 'Rupite' TaxID=2813851 RepID=A0ABT0C7K4_THEVL|nr:alkene reductase [Thermostichus vulcanus]MCJ2541736.1 alkene reductase [Thermostichus vulcanus str. 'Rupite']